MEKATPFIFLFDIDNPDEQSQQLSGKTCRSENKCRTPYLFVDRTAVLKKQAGKSKNGSPYQSFLYPDVIVFVLHNQFSEQKSDKNMSNGRKGAQQPFGIESNGIACRIYIFIHMIYTKNRLVDNGNDVVFRFLETVPQQQHQEISCQQDHNHPNQLFMIEQHCSQCRKAISKSQALQNTQNTQCIEMGDGRYHNIFTGSQTVAERTKPI